MHPILSDISDHNAVWVGLQWPETPPALKKYTESTRITNHPDLPNNVDAIESFRDTLDNLVADERILHPDTDQMTPAYAGRVQGKIVCLSVDLARRLSPKRVIRRMGKGSTFKDGYSPDFLLLKASLHAHVDIRRLLWKRTRKRSDKDEELMYILGVWRKKRQRLADPTTPHPHRHLFPKGWTIKDFLWQDITKKIEEIRRQLHGRQRLTFRLAMSSRVKDLETLLATRKLGKLIKMLLPKSSAPLNFNLLLDANGEPYRSDTKIDRAAAETMS